MQTIYCIPGLGADENVFQQLDLSFAKPVFVNWIMPSRGDTLGSYALRLQKQFIKEESPVIVGLSLGGMLAVEMVKAIPGARAIIISSAKTRKEIPFYWRMFRHLPIYKHLSHASVQNAAGIQQYFVGANSPVARKYMLEAIKKADERFYKWALGAILSWENRIVPSNIIHIHGTNDKLLPFKYVKADVSVNNAGHLMIIENAPEISLLLRRILTDSFKEKTENSKKCAQ